MTSPRRCVAALVLCWIALSAGPAWAAQFRFVTWADSRLDGASVLARLSRQATALSPAFTLFAGDLETSGFTVSEIAVWSGAVDGDTTGATRDGLGAVTFPVRGNHDGRDGAGWQAYFDVARTAARIGATHFTALSEDLTYSFDYQNSHFVALDIPGDLPRHLTAAKLSWLDQDLAAAEARGLTHAFLVWHGPIVTLTAGHRIDPDGAGVHALVDVLNEHPIVSAIFVGHEHLTACVHVTAARVSNVRHEFEQFTQGGAGARLYAPDAAKPDAYLRSHAFATVDVADASYTVSWYPLDSATASHVFHFTKRSSPANGK